MYINNGNLYVFRSIFQEMISMDTLIVQIMNQAQKLGKLQYCHPCHVTNL